MSSAPSPEEIWKDARWLAQAVDPRAGLVRVVEMTPEAYRDASFLDDRMLQQPRTTHLLPWSEVASSSPADARADARWIFHIGHVGSTLIARLLGELESVLSVREPRSLRDLAFFPRAVRAPFVPTVRALHSRTFGSGQTAVVKATSFVSEIASELIPDESRALYLYATPHSYIAGILAGENSRAELSALAETRRQRLASRAISLPDARSEADLAAAAWACEMTALTAADGPKVLWADFDQALSDMEGSLRRFADFLNLDAKAQFLSQIANGPLMRRYSKATEYEYSPQLRRDLLSEAAGRHASDIETALAMLDRASETAPLLRKALDRAQAES
ncbi:hypothetical protein LZ016_05405 [Sphingomonas sp. SM33]|uniref:Uncharacterized protein n=1 Tax=Sphingomonas telluris TaxID=2907998 RepID=A0ABS9VKQ3_9SPHN|nr:hypothetical protein [Sphingomonas telluris]MCH8615535.1 hypothetical protein [Sphingomonas telluris]